MGIISIKCVITRVSDSRAPGPLEKRAPLLSAEARRGILSMPVNASFNATIPFSFLKADPWKFEMSPFPPFVSPFSTYNTRRERRKFRVVDVRRRVPLLFEKIIHDRFGVSVICNAIREVERMKFSSEVSS